MKYTEFPGAGDNKFRSGDTVRAELYNGNHTQGQLMFLDEEDSYGKIRACYRIGKQLIYFNVVKNMYKL